MKHYGKLRIAPLGNREILLDFNGGFEFISLISFLQQTYKHLEVLRSDTHRIHLIVRGFNFPREYEAVQHALTDAILYAGWEPYNPPGEDSRSEYYRYGYEA